MRIGIAVFKKNWVEAAPLFKFLDAFGIKIEGQDLCGDRVSHIKNTHLIVDDKIARWVDFDGFSEFMQKDFAKGIHYDLLIHNIKKLEKSNE